MNDRIYNQKVEKLRLPERLEGLEYKRVVDLCLQNDQIKSVLDVGTGSGIFAEEFFKRGLTVAGTDLNPEMLEAAANFVPSCTFKLGQAEKLPFESSTFDLVFMGLVFHEVSDYQAAMNEAFRVSSKYTAILEWKYVLEEIGPPLEHRLKSDFIKEVSAKAGFTGFMSMDLKLRVLYLLTK